MRRTHSCVLLSLIAVCVQGCAGQAPHQAALADAGSVERQAMPQPAALQDSQGPAPRSLQSLATRVLGANALERVTGRRTRIAELSELN